MVIRLPVFFNSVQFCHWTLTWDAANESREKKCKHLLWEKTTFMSPSQHWFLCAPGLGSNVHIAWHHITSHHTTAKLTALSECTFWLLWQCAINSREASCCWVSVLFEVSPSHSPSSARNPSDTCFETHSPTWHFLHLSTPQMTEDDLHCMGHAAIWPWSIFHLTNASVLWSSFGRLMDTSNQVFCIDCLRIDNWSHDKAPPTADLLFVLTESWVFGQGHQNGWPDKWAHSGLLR